MAIMLLTATMATAQSFEFQYQGKSVADGGTVTIAAVPDEYGFGEYWCESNPSSNPNNGLILKLLSGTTATGSATLNIERNSLNPQTLKWCMGGECSMLNDKTTLDKTFTVSDGSVQVQFDAENCQSEGDLLASLTATIGSETHTVNILFTYGSAGNEESEEIWWGYMSEADLSSTTCIGTGSANVQFLTGIYVPANNEQIGNSTIKAVRIYVNNGLGSTMSNVSVWISKSLPATLKAADYVQSVKSLTDGANDIELKTPFSVNNNAFYIGYAVTSSNAYPIMCCGTQDAPNAFLISAPGSLDWQDLNGNGFGKLAFQILADGVNITSNSATPSDFGTAYVLKGETYDVPVTITNNGKNTITSISYTITTGSTTTEEATEYVDNLTFNSSAKVYIPFASDDEAKKYNKTLTITKVNGEANDATQNSAQGAVITITEKPVPVPVVEEFTGTWCGYCPYGYVGMEKTYETYGDKVVLIAAHNSDPMEVSDYNPIMALVDGFPSSFINRTQDVYPSVSTLNYYVSQSLNRVTVGSIQAKAMWTSDAKTEISIDTETKFVYNDDNGQYGIAYVLTEDGMSGTGSNWAQSNYLSGGSGDPDMALFYNSGSKVTGLTFNFVAVGAWNIVNGVNGSVNSTITAGEVQNYNFKADITSKSVIQDKSKLKVAALLIDQSTGGIVNAAQVTIQDFNAAAINGIHNTTATEAVRYTLDGRQVSAPQRGLNIIRLGDGTVRKVMVK